MTFEFADGPRPLVPEFPHEIAGDGAFVHTPAHDDVRLLARFLRYRGGRVDSTLFSRLADDA